MRYHIAAKPFRSFNEIDAYFSGEEIMCLECGKSFQALGAHLNAMHDMSAQEYRLKYNIPKTRSLTTKALAEKSSSSRKKLIKERPDLLKFASYKVQAGGYKGVSREYLKMASNKGATSIQNKSRQHNKKLFPQVIKLLKKGLRFSEISKQDGMPKDKNTIAKWRKLYPEFNAMLEKAAPEIPFQNRMALKLISKNDVLALLRPMVNQGLSYNKISKELGISDVTVKKYVSEMTQK